MSYWDLDKEQWEDEDNHDGALWMTHRGRIEVLEKAYSSEYRACSDND